MTLNRRTESRKTESGRTLRTGSRMKLNRRTGSRMTGRKVDKEQDDIKPDNKNSIKNFKTLSL